MIERDPPFYWDVSCDGCSVGEERIEGDDDDFGKVINEIKARGWRIKKDRYGDWVHYCPDC